MQQKSLIKRLQEITDKAESIKKEHDAWKKDYEESKFMKRKKGPSKEALAITKLFTDTDHLARLVWDNTFKIIYANKNFLSRMGYSLDEIVGKNIVNEDGTSDFMTEDTLAESMKVVNTNMENGVVMSSGVNNKWISKEGEEVPVKWLIGFNDYNSGVGTSQCLFITENP